MKFLLWFMLVVASAAHAAPLDLSGQWYKAGSNAGPMYQGQANLEETGLIRADEVSLTGGHFWFQAEFNIQEPGLYVLDFKNTSIIGQFRHLVFDEDHNLIASMEGGIQRSAENPFFLRHGREFELSAGRYKLVTEIDSPFYLAQPEPYIDHRDHYR